MNALLIGGEGNDDLEYFASGQAVLVGNGGNNILIGGSKSTIDAFGDTIDPSQPDPLLSPPSWFSQLPPQIVNFLSSTQGEGVVPTDETTTESISGGGTGDFLEGGAGGNAIAENGDNFAIVTEGNTANQINVGAATTRPPLPARRICSLTTFTSPAPYQEALRLTGWA